jgi:23S rRNA pseudouridine1911/1915/1917 synthase
MDAEDIVDDGLTEEEDGGQLHEHHRFVADRNQSLLRVDKFLFDRLSDISRNRIQAAADAGYIYVNGAPVKNNYKVKPMDVITVMLEHPHHDFEIIPEEIPLDIVYEDAELLVVNKQPGLVVHPAHGNRHGTLLNALAYYLRDDDGFDAADPSIGLAHRIDKDTSGLLVIAKRPDTKSNLSKQFFNKTTKRLYVAMVWGVPCDEEECIEGNIGRDPRDRQRMAVFPDGESGKKAVTHRKTIEKLGYVSLQEFRLETGRTHQIRVHSAFTGHPVFNDGKYGGDRVLKGLPTSNYNQFIHNCFATCPRQALHAATLGFVHPVTKEELYFEAAMPDDMQQLLTKWRNYISASLFLHSPT